MKGVILHEGDSIGNGKYCGIFYMENMKQKPKELKQIKQPYLLLFEKNGIAPPSTPSPSTIGNQPVLPPTAESMEINHQETETTTDECHIDIDMSQPALPQCSPLPTPPEESMSIDIHRS